MAITEKQKKKTEAAVRKHFTGAGHWWVDAEGFVNVTGLLTAKPSAAPADGRLPVKFGEVKGDLNLRHMGLTTLEGCPSRVSGWLYLEGNPITSLAHAPREVGKLVLFDNKELQSLEGCPQRITRGFQMWHSPQLKSLQGLPTEPGIIEELDITYDEHLHLLSALVANKIVLRTPGGGYNYLSVQQPVTDIMNNPQWVGKGKVGALNCALALKKAGFGGNAGW